MIEDTKIAKKIEAKAGGKSGTYWTVTWQDGKTDNIFNGEWLPLLEQSQQKNQLLHFTKEKKGNYYNVISLELATLSEKESAVKSIPQAEGQARGMVTKEIGDMIRSKNLKTLFGDEASFELVKWYRSQILSITRVPCDGAKLPDFKREIKEV